MKEEARACVWGNREREREKERERRMEGKMNSRWQSDNPVRSIGISAGPLALHTPLT